jgi:small multidrug resistance family-3 protein
VHHHATRSGPHNEWIRIGAGVIAPGLHGAVATFRSDNTFGRIPAAYGGILVAGSIARA